MKRALAILLAMAMLFSACAVLAFAEESPIKAVLNVETIDQSGEDQEVTLTVSAASGITANAFNFTVNLPDGFSIGEVAGDGENVLDEELATESNIENGYIAWTSGDLENKELTTLAVLTIVVPANCDAQDYDIVVDTIAASKDYSTEEVWETGNDYEATATLTVEVAIASIKVTKVPAKGEYYEGQKFDPTGMEVTVYYTDGSTQVLTEGYTWEPADELDPEDAAITISYEGETTSLPISVKPHADHKWSMTEYVPATLAKTGKIVNTCECGLEDVTVLPIVEAQPKVLEPIPSTVVIDGKFDDTIWNDAWIEVDGDNGFYQTLPTTEDTLSYSYQVISEGGYMYVAVIANCDPVEGGNGAGTNVRLWLHNGDEEATVYTHFYDAFIKDGAIATNSKYNTQKTTNKADNIKDPAINAAYTAADGKTCFEFCVPLAEFGGENGFKYHMAVSNKKTENLCLFYPSVELPEGTGRTKVLPYTVWLSEAEPADAAELINIDGKFDDGMWNGEWIDVDKDNGFWQTLPTTDDLSYSYQIVTAGDYMYVAVIANCDAVEGGNGNGTNVRLWLHNGDEEATVYTHFYDAFIKDGAIATNSKYNTQKTANKAADIANPAINAAYTAADGKTCFEFCVPLAEFGGENGFTYHMAVSNKVNENICLFYPSVELPEGTGRTKVLPYAVWTSEATATEIATGSNLVFINYAGYKYATGISFILAGDKMTVAELTELGYGTAKDLNYVYTYVCDAEGNVIEEYETLGKPDGVKSDVICPEGGFILGFHGDLGKPEIDAGDKLTVHNVLIKNMRGVADNQKLTNAFVEIHKHNYELIETVAPTLAKKGYDICKCSDCGKETNMNWVSKVYAQPYNYALDGTIEMLPYVDTSGSKYNTSLNDGVALEKCTYAVNEWYGVHASNSTNNVGVINLDLGVKQNISMTRIHFIEGKKSGIQSPAAVKIEVSADGVTYTEVANETYGEPKTTEFAYTWYNYEFEAVDAQYIRYSITKQGSFAFLNEIEVYGDERPEVKPTEGTLFNLGYAGLYFDAAASCVLAGDGETTVGELVALGDGESNELAWWDVVVCDKDGIVITAVHTGGSGTTKAASMKVPEGGFAIAVHCGGVNANFKSIAVGDKIILHNVLLENMRGVADTQALSSSWLEVHKHTFVKGETVAPTLAKEGYTVYTCEDCTYSTHMDIVPVVRAQKDYENPENLALGQKYTVAVEAGSNYYTDLTDGITSNTVKWVAGEWCNPKGDNTAVVELAEIAKITSARIHTLYCTNSSGISNAKSVKVEVSKDGETYTQVAYEEYEKEPLTSGWNAVWLTYTFDAIEAKYVRFTIEKHTNFCMIDEIEVFADDAPPAVPMGAFILDYAGFRFEADITALLMGYADKEAKISELAYLGGAEDDDEADLNYFHVVICDKDGKVVKVLSTLGRPAGIKSNEIVPAGGFAVVGHGGKGSALDKVKVGDIATIGNVLTENIRGVADNQKMTDAFVMFHSHDFKVKEVVKPTLAKKGYSVYECSCGETENRDETPVVKAQPDKLEELPDGAKTIGFAGAKYAGGVSFVLAGDNMTVKELVALGNNGAGKDLHYFFIYVVDKDGVVVEVNEHVGEVKDDALNDKSDIVCPEGGFILAVHNDCGKPTGIEVGKLLTLHNVDLNAMRGVADNQALTNAFITVKDKYLKGDVNGDGVVDAFDYQMLKAYVMGTYEPTADELERMHLTDDDEVDAFDYQLLKAVVMGQASFDED